MVKRSVNSPWGNVYKEGLPSTAVDDKTLVDQEVRPTINTGSINVETGKWTGVTLSDEINQGITTHLDIANLATVLVPATATSDYIDMSGFCDLILAIKPTVTGTYGMQAVMGPNTNSVGGLSPVNSGVSLRYARNSISTFEPLFDDSNETLTANVWNIFMISQRCENQKNLQFLLTNSSGSQSSIYFSYLRAK